MPHGAVERRFWVSDSIFHHDGHFGLVRLADDELGLLGRDISQSGKRQVLYGIEKATAIESIGRHQNENGVDDKGQDGSSLIAHIGRSISENLPVRNTLFSHGDLLIDIDLLRLDRCPVAVIWCDGRLSQGDVDFIVNHFKLRSRVVRGKEGGHVNGEE